MCFVGLCSKLFVVYVAPTKSNGDQKFPFARTKLLDTFRADAHLVELEHPDVPVRTDIMFRLDQAHTALGQLQAAGMFQCFCFVLELRHSEHCCMFGKPRIFTTFVSKH